MSKFVWVIEEGNYSDYRVSGVFSSKDDADFMASKIGGTVAKWPLNPCVDELRKGYKLFLGEMLYDGTVERMVDWSAELSGYYLTHSLEIWRRSTAPAYQGKGVQDCLHGTVFAKDIKHAVKIFNEQRTQLIAQNKWHAP